MARRLLLNKYGRIKGFNYTIAAQCLGWPVSQSVLEGRKGGSSSQVKGWVVMIAEGLRTGQLDADREHTAKGAS